MQQNVTTGLGGDLCGPPAKQTDEGNLSCGSCFAELGGDGGWEARGGGRGEGCCRSGPLLLASPVTCQFWVGAEGGGANGMHMQRREGGETDEDDAAGKCQTFALADISGKYGGIHA